jgi:hypothetical protein
MNLWLNAFALHLTVQKVMISKEIRTRAFMNVNCLSSKDSRSVFTPEVLTCRWGIGLDTATRTLNATTHNRMVRSNMPYDCTVRQCFDQLKFLTIGGMWYTDTTFAKIKSIQVIKCSRVWTNGLGFDQLHPLEAKRDVHQSLTWFIKDVGMPNLVILDDSNTQVAGEFDEIASLHHIKRMMMMPYSPWQNQAESSIQELKRVTICLMRKHNSPRGHGIMQAKP